MRVGIDEAAMTATTAEARVREGERGALARATWIQAGRVLARTLRMPTVIIQGLAFPMVLMVLLLASFSEVVEAYEPGVEYVQRLVPLVAITGAVFGGLANGAAVVSERNDGLLGRFRTLPSPRAAPLAGQVVAEAGRILGGTVAMVAVASLLGFRFQQGPLAAVGFFVVIVLYGSAFTWLVLALALRAGSYESLAVLAPLFLLLLFLNTGFVPLDAYPGALQPVVRAAPHTAVTDLLMGLSVGGPVAEPLVRAALWTTAITGVFATLAIRRFERI